MRIINYNPEKIYDKLFEYITNQPKIQSRLGYKFYEIDDYIINSIKKISLNNIKKIEIVGSPNFCIHLINENNQIILRNLYTNLYNITKQHCINFQNTKEHIYLFSVDINPNIPKSLTLRMAFHPTNI